MKSYRNFLSESADKNLHMTHLEDLALDGGVSGVRGAIEFLQSFRDMLDGDSDKSANITVKFDGAPAVFAGTNPENGRFFVGTKSVFNRSFPKINYTDSDIDKNHSGELAAKLKIALKYLSKMNIDGIVQGDMMFTDKDLETKTIHGEKYITFHPNTIVYALPPDSKEGKAVARAKLGIVFHTTYSGDTMESMRASFGANVRNMTHSSDIWARDASFRDVSGSATFTKREYSDYVKKLSIVGKHFQQLSASFLNEIARNQQINLMLNVHANFLIRNNKTLRSSTRVIEFSKWLDERYKKAIDKVKTDKAKKIRQDELNYLKRWVSKNRSNLVALYELQKAIVDAKNAVIRKLQTVKGIGTFVKTDSGFKVTAPEGFVAIRDSGAIKLVDRLEFSLHNFTAAKAWDK